MTILKFKDLKKKESFHSNMDSEHINTIQINDHLILSKDKKTLIHCPKTFTGHFDVPQGVEIIGIEAFAGCKGLSSVTIPESLSEIRMLAFAECKNLRKISFVRHKFVSIADDAFMNIDFNNYILKIPAASLSQYKNNSNCKQFISIQEITLPIVEFQNYENKQAI